MFEVGKEYVNTQSNKTAKCVYIDTHHQIAVLSGSGGLYTPPTNSPYWKETRRQKYWVALVEYAGGMVAHAYTYKPEFYEGTFNGRKVIAIQEHEWVEENV